MGSLDRAMLTGFICRLCSEMHKSVTHIYGEMGRANRLAEKINKYLPVDVSYADPLPKTICSTCLSRLESQHKLVVQIQLVKQQLVGPQKKKITLKKKRKN